MFRQYIIHSDINGVFFLADGRRIVQKNMDRIGRDEKIYSAPTRGSFSDLGETIAYADTYQETFAAVSLFEVDTELLSGEMRDAGVEQAVTRLKHLLEKPHQQFFSSLETAEDEREAFYLIAENLLAPLAGECVLKCK